MPGIRGVVRNAGRRPLTVARTLLMLAVTVSWTGLAPEVHAQGQAPAAETSLEERYERAFQEMFADPANLDKAFDYARFAIQMKDFEGAISTLERMLLINADLPRVRMELGVLYFRLGSFEVAKGYLQEVLADETVPAVVAGRAEGFLAQIEEQTSRHKIKGIFFAGIRHQSNANAGPSTTRVRVLGLDIDLDSTFTNQSDVDTFETVRLTHSYDLGLVPRAEIESELILYQANQATQDQVDTSLAQVKSGPRFYADPDIARGLDYRPYLRWDLVNLADRQYYAAFGGGIDGNYVLGPSTRISSDAFLVQRNHNNTATNPSLTDLNGLRAGLSASLLHALSPSLRASGSAAVQREVTEDRGRRNWLAEASLGLTQVFSSPFPDLTGPWSLAGTARISKTIYDDPNANIDPNVTREDESYSGQVVAGVQLTGSTSLVATGIYKKVRSNLVNFAYDN
jgi:tetratricopeptide (TPR) repeat protein